MRNRWSYKVERIKVPVFSSIDKRNQVVEEALNRLGMDGWELISARPSTDGVGVNCYLKRPS
jgi:hypothetical protein